VTTAHDRLMKHAALTAIAPASPQAASTWLVRLLRVVVIVLLIFDQVSAPLHNHHHDAGPDGIMQQFLLSDAHASDSNVQQADPPAAFHAVTGIKREARHSAVFQNAEELPPLIRATLFTVIWDAHDTLPRVWPAKARYSIVTYRSLPPCGRAPPLHT
jgi:hypothetical protein